MCSSNWVFWKKVALLYLDSITRTFFGEYKKKRNPETKEYELVPERSEQTNLINGTCLGLIKHIKRSYKEKPAINNKK